MSNIAQFNHFVRFKKLSYDAAIPRKANEHSAGFDLFASKSVIIPRQHGRAVVDTDIAMELPFGSYGRIASRSGLSCKYGIEVGAGVVDCDYRGAVRVLLYNFGEEDYIVSKGDRIAQLIVEKMIVCDIIQVDELNETTRGGNGFGSSGY